MKDEGGNMERRKIALLLLSVLLAVGMVTPLAVSISSPSLASPSPVHFPEGQSRNAARESAVTIVNLTILHTNDIHSHLLPWPVADYKDGVGNDQTIGGIARIATLVSQIRGEKSSIGEGVLLVDAGDFLMGTPFQWTGVNSSKNVSAELHMMSLMGYDVICLGNHEFDYTDHGLAVILNNTNSSITMPPILCSNLEIVNDAYGLSRFIKDNLTLTVTTNGKTVKVGFFSVIGYNANSSIIFQENFRILDPVTVAEEEVKYLKSQGVDLIILLSHSGWREDIELAKKVSGIDVIIGGHDHELLEQPKYVVRDDGTNTTIVDVKCYSEYLGKLEISFALGHPGQGVHVRAFQAIPINDSIAENATIKSELNKYIPAINAILAEYGWSSYDQVIASGHVEIGSEEEEHAIGDLVADAMRWAAENITGEHVDFALVESGVLRQGMTSASGNITVYDAISVAPLGGIPYQGPYTGLYLCKFYIYGYEVKRALEFALAGGFFLQVSGLRYVYDPTGIPSQKVMRIDQITDSGEIVPIEDDKLYSVCVDVWTAALIPEVSKAYPIFRIEPKYANGTLIKTEPMEEYLASIMIVNGTKLVPEWHALTAYLKDALKGTVPDEYSKPQGRITAWQWFTLNPEDLATFLTLYAIGQAAVAPAASTSLMVGVAAAIILVGAAAAAAITSRRT
nr:bifunctional UDP-sugar hydrolase/5'-nucleotidase [Candidatus Freyrarchaeum guaymaensis]